MTVESREQMTVNEIVWLGHASVRIDGEKTVYIDPWKLAEGQPRADIVLITHSHYDHCSEDDVAQIADGETIIFASADCQGELSQDFRPVAPGQLETVGGVIVETVSAYNLNKEFHPRANDWVGYLLEMGGERIYYAGDTDLIPEMDEIKADIVILPVGGTYTMTAEEAAEAANRIKPGLAIPIHYGDIVGTEKDAEKFKELCRVPVSMLSVGR